MSYLATLIHCIEMDWCVVVRCRVCGHITQWGAQALVDRFRDSLRATVGEIAEKVADHCGDRPAVYTLNGAGMDPWTIERFGDVKDFDFRDMRLREFLERQGLPKELADERKAEADAWLERLGVPTGA